MVHQACYNVSNAHSGKLFDEAPMKHTRRAYRDETDLARIAGLVRDEPREHIHLVDLPYRLCSWAFDEPQNCALWEDERGGLLAWAVLQPPFWTVDYALGPQAPEQLLPELLAWADERARAVAATPFGRPAWFVNVFDGQRSLQRALEAAGFAPQTDVGPHSWSKVLFRRPLREIEAGPALPAGFRLRPLGGLGEVDAYVALHQTVFETKNMTGAWRARMLAHPGYRPELDLVVEDAGGQLAAFCVGWFTPQGRGGQPEGQIEPLGVRADVRRAGVGRALMLACLRQMAELGAVHARVETDNYRDAAYRFYEALGFAVEQNIVVYRKDYPPKVVP
jgi:ribosomal protein S18 acetylase RimI-like enzyme